MANQAIIDQAADFAFSQLEEVENRIETLTLPVRIFLMVYLAQVVIDNGGLEYFFANDFPENPPYRQFVDAYREIGAQDAADAIEKALVYFDFDQPETKLALRQEFVASLAAEASHEFSSLSSRVCENESIWECLEHYAEKNQKAFEVAAS